MDFQTVIEKTKKEYKEDLQKSEAESEVISKYGDMFNPKNIDNLTKENFESFLRSKNNRHWRHRGRQGPEITKNMKKLKNTLRIFDIKKSYYSFFMIIYR